MSIQDIQAALAARDEAVQTAQQLLDGSLPENQQRDAATRALKMAGLSTAEIEARLSSIFQAEADDQSRVGVESNAGGTSASSGDANVTVTDLMQQIAALKAEQAELKRLAMVRSTERIESTFNSVLEQSIKAQDGLGQIEGLLKKAKAGQDAGKVLDGVKESIRKEAIQTLLEVKNRDGVVTEAAVAKAVKDASAKQLDTIKPLLSALKSLGASPASGVWESVLNKPTVKPPEKFVPGRDNMGTVSTQLNQWAADVLSKQTARNMIERENARVL